MVEGANEGRRAKSRDERWEGSMEVFLDVELQQRSRAMLPAERAEPSYTLLTVQYQQHLGT
jgi:hypothetical protein